MRKNKKDLVPEKNKKDLVPEKTKKTWFLKN